MPSRPSILIITGTLSLATIISIVTSVNPNVEAVPATYAFFTKWGNEGSGNGQFEYPRGIAVDPSTHEVYVSDTGNHRIQKFKLASQCPVDTTQITLDVCLITEWGKFGSGNKHFKYPFGIAVDPSTHEVYVSDTYNHRIQKFTGSGTYVTKWGSEGLGDGQFEYPQGIAVDPSTHEVYVSDTPNHRIQKFTGSGTYITKWGSYGSGNGQFEYPRGIAVDPSTHEVYIADSYNNRIQKFRLSTQCRVGTTQIESGVCFVIKWGSAGGLPIGDGQFHNPSGINLDTSHDIYIADTSNARIQKFKLASQCPVDTTQITLGVCFITKWGNWGSGNGQFRVPIDLAIDSSNDQVYVVDSQNHRIEVFAHQ